MNLIFIDIKTTGSDPFKDEITLIQIKQGSTIRLIETFTDDKIAEIKDLLENNLIVGHNLKFDLKFLNQQFVINPLNLFDIWVAEIIISGGIKARQKETTTLEAIVKDRLNIDLNNDKELRTLFKDGDLSSKNFTKYAIEVAVLPHIYKRQNEQLKELGLERVFEMEMGCIPATAWLEISGIPFDFDGLKRIQIETEKKIEDATAKQAIGLNCEINIINDCHKRQKLLTELGRYNYPKYINPLTKRIHSNFNQLGANTGRFSSSEPSLQNVSREKIVRALFKAGVGKRIIKADYSQSELRIIAEVSQEPKFIEVFNNGGDLHKLSASLIFNKQMEHISEKERNIAKSINFGLSYGMGPTGLQVELKDNGIEINIDDARKWIDTFFKSYPKVKSYLDEAGQSAVRNNQIRNIAGRLIKYKPALNETEHKKLLRDSKNNLIQSLNADILKGAMGRLYLKLKPFNVKLINAVHDELVFEVPENQVDVIAQIIKEEMEAAGKEYLKSIPCIVNVVDGDSWE